MMKPGLIVLVLAGVCGVMPGGQPPTEPAEVIRVGTYDNRAIAIAYAASPFNVVNEKMAEYERAKADGDTDRVNELDAWGKKHQRHLHRQGFGRVPVDDLLAAVKDRIPAVAAAAELDVIMWSYDYKGANVEVVDVTMELVQLYEPSDRTLKWINDLKNVPPVDLDVLEQHQDDH